MGNGSTLKEFWRTTYRSGSPIPYIISVQVILFVLIHLFDLLYEIGATSIPLYSITVNKLSLPANFHNYIQQPWSIVTYPFIHKGLFQILFDCLWLYWIGNIFLNLLHSRQLLTLYIGATIIGGLAYLGLGQIDYLYNSPQTTLYTGNTGTAAVLTALLVLVPTTELRLLIIGTVKLRTVGLIYLGIQFAFYLMINKMAAGAFVVAIAWGWVFMYLLKEGNDLSKYFRKKKKSKLKVVHTRVQAPSSRNSRNDMPNQEIIDAILDKISLSGYDSLTAQEKETLFRASKQENE